MDIAYTDGSFARQGGWSAVIRGQRDYEIAGRFDAKDSYETELFAVYMALEQSQGEISIVCDHLAIVETLQQILDKGSDWNPPEDRKDLWLKVKSEALRVLQDVRWSKCDSTHEQRLAHKMANAQANVEVG